MWIKLCPDQSFGQWDSSTPDVIGQAAMRFGPMESAVAFGHGNDLVVKGMSFRDDAPWSPQPSRIVAVDATAAVNADSTLTIVRQEIRRLSGGPVSIGTKGLFWGTTSLECHLSSTDSLWPGDVDAILFSDDVDCRPIAILEYKKHNLDTPLQDQRLSNYYPSPDGRKYNRMAILARQLAGSEDVPVVVVYYSTKEHITQVKLELIEGLPRFLRSSQSANFDFAAAPTDATRAEFLDAVLALASSHAT